ncbi:hypothetical protein FRC08_001812 [Ceratobasidium sp. 394]|nr:hypothetical protein FRC08_001812 [Ceratobasidium sp. 394]
MYAIGVTPNTTHISVPISGFQIVLLAVKRHSHAGAKSALDAVEKHQLSEDAAFGTLCGALLRKFAIGLPRTFGVQGPQSADLLRPRLPHGKGARWPPHFQPEDGVVACRPSSPTGSLGHRAYTCPTWA